VGIYSGKGIHRLVYEVKEDEVKDCEEKKITDPPVE
jgi:Txe/YoeB family toxin of Txe-Axe toxin-antitoxin module